MQTFWEETYLTDRKNRNISLVNQINPYICCKVNTYGIQERWIYQPTRHCSAAVY